MIFVVYADRCRRTRARDVALARHAVVHRRPATVHNRVLAGCGAPCSAPSWARGPAAARRVGRATSACSGRCGTAGTDTPCTPGAPARVRSAAVPRTRRLPVGGCSGAGPTHPAVPPDGRHAGYAIAETTRGRGRQTGRDVSATVWYALATTRRTPCQSPVLARRSLRRAVGRTPAHHAKVRLWPAAACGGL